MLLPLLSGDCSAVPFVLREFRAKKRPRYPGSFQLVEKIDFAHEVGFLNQFFATGFPGQKTLLSQQVCGLGA